jgi:glycosyltransferase involved in cell wall biosynthesis
VGAPPRRVVHQLVAAAAPHDAVTGQTLAWQQAMARWGVGGEIYAEHIHPELLSTVRPIGEFRDEPSCAALLRYSIWSAAAECALTVEHERLGLWYHNITPARLLAEAHPEVAVLCERGRGALPLVVGAAAVAIADSSFNAAELRGAGAGAVSVVPLLLPAGEPPEPRAAPEPIVLTVGRVVPSKRIEDAIRAVALLRARHVADATLVVVGSWSGFERYHDALVRFAAAIGAAGAVTFTGPVDDDERDRRYRIAGAYVCTSEHEGFCLPLIEALAMGVPVVARAAGAIPETLGSAGLVLPGADPALVAEALAAVLTDTDLRRGLGEHARDRLAELAPARVEARGRAALEPLLRGGSRS